MKIIVIGASKGIGRQTVMAALKNGHTVTAFSRHPKNLKLQHPRLRLHAGNALDAALVSKAINGHEAVICTLGLPTGQAMGLPFSKVSPVLSTGTNNILSAMAAQGVKRLICVTAIGTGDSVKQCTLLTRLVLRWGLKRLFKEKDIQEELIRKSTLQWTIIRPTALTNSRRKNIVITENVRSGVLTHISRADVAATMIEMLDKPKTYKKSIALSYSPRLGDSVRWIIGYAGF